MYNRRQASFRPGKVPSRPSNSSHYQNSSSQSSGSQNFPVNPRNSQINQENVACNNNSTCIQGRSDDANSESGSTVYTNESCDTQGHRMDTADTSPGAEVSYVMSQQNPKDKTQPCGEMPDASVASNMNACCPPEHKCENQAGTTTERGDFDSNSCHQARANAAQNALSSKSRVVNSGGDTLEKDRSATDRHKQETLGEDRSATDRHKQETLGEDRFATDRHKQETLGEDRSATNRFKQETLGGDRSATKRYKQETLGEDRSATNRHKQETLGGNRSATNRHKQETLGGDRCATNRYKQETLGGDRCATNRYKQETDPAARSGKYYDKQKPIISYGPKTFVYEESPPPRKRKRERDAHTSRRNAYLNPSPSPPPKRTRKSESQETRNEPGFVSECLSFFRGFFVNDENSADLPSYSPGCNSRSSMRMYPDTTQQGNENKDDRKDGCTNASTGSSSNASRPEPTLVMIRNINVFVRSTREDSSMESEDRSTRKHGKSERRRDERSKRKKKKDESRLAERLKREDCSTDETSEVTSLLPDCMYSCAKKLFKKEPAPSPERKKKRKE